MKRNLLFVVSCIIAWLVMETAFAATNQPRQTIETVASQIARDHNARNLSDEMTVSSTAQAVGKNVIFRNVLRVQQGLSASKLAEFKRGIYAETLPQVCAVNRQSFAMRTGLYYTFIYENTYGERLADFVVTGQACGVK